MLNLELARIVVAERRRELDQHLRAGRFRVALTERAAGVASRRQDDESAARSCAESGSGAAPAVG